MNNGLPQIIYFILVVYSLFDGFKNDGNYREVKSGHVVLCNIIMTSLLYWGGFFG